MSKFYTEEMNKYIADNYKGKTIENLQKEFNNKFNTNITYTAMKSYLSAHKLKVGRRNEKHRKYKNEHIEFLKNNVKGITLKELTNRFNKEFNMNVNESAIANLKVKYDLQSGIVGGRFEKGQVSWNKGKKMSSDQYKKCAATMFRKGNVPANRRPIGSERIDKNGYILIKIQDGHKSKNWIRKHRYLYEKAYGKIPKGYRVIFADGNNRNFDLDNLVLISNAEELIMNRNKLFKQDKDLTKAGVTVAKLLDKVNKRKKDIENERRN